MNKSKINSISIENYRVFKNKSEFKMAPITILTGANSSGKSSVIKALKLLQNFWHNLSEEGILDFSTGTHELGDYENVLPYSAEKKEIIISYKLNKHILFGELCIENIFKISDNQDIKNGVLKKSSLYQLNEENKVLLYEIKYEIDSHTKEENNIKEYYINTNLILNTFIPKLKKIIKQRETFLEKCPRPHKSNRQDVLEGEIYTETFGDYIGDASCVITQSFNPEKELLEDITFLQPVVNQELCRYIGIDFEVWKDMEANEGVSFLKNYEKNIDRDLFQKDKQLLQTEEAGLNRYNSIILALISRISLEKYEDFEEELWQQLRTAYPDVNERIGRDKFHYLTSDVDDQAKEIILEYKTTLEVNRVLNETSDWKILISKYSGIDFSSLFQQFEEKEFENLSYSKHTGQIIDFNFQSKVNSIESAIFYYFLYYSIFLDKKIFNHTYKNTSSLNIESTIPLLSDIRKEMERISYTLVKATSDNMFFVDAIRANAQRFYTFSSQNTSFNHVLLKYLRQSRSTSEEEFIRKWIKEFEIGDDVIFGKVSTIGADIKIQIGDRRVNLIDLGYGVTPFLALLINIISSINEKSVSSRKNSDLKELSHSFRLVENTIVIEEPEVSLHPKLQSKLADFFWDAHKRFNVNFIVETHSEYLIRKFQYLTAKGIVKTDDVILHYIDNPDDDKRREKELQIRTIHIEYNGDLSSPFGKGFLDEADNLAMKLWSFFK